MACLKLKILMHMQISIIYNLNYKNMNWMNMMTLYLSEPRLLHRFI